MQQRKKRVIELHRSRPFVSIETKPETRRDHARMALLMALTTLIVLGGAIPNAAAVFPAFIAGDAFSNWYDYPDGGEEVSA